MNILIPDTWLREYLKTDATPAQIKEYLSLCGPSIERIYGTGKETVYDIEITGNRPDGMSVMGVAREAATILPRFGIAAHLTEDPYRNSAKLPAGKRALKLTVKTDPALNPRWTSVVFDAVTIQPSPSWLKNFLELAGMRSLNNVIDITNFLMHAYGQPAHVFDYDAIFGHTMTLRASRKGEKLMTLDGKMHTLPGNDIVIEDGTHKPIDLCGIMGGKSSSVNEHTKRVILFLQTYDATHIRKTSMNLGHRTAAAALFEKGLDTELVKPVFMKGITMMEELTGGHIASVITDLYPKPYTPARVSVSIPKIHAYIGEIKNQTMKEILTALGFGVTITLKTLTVLVPSFRRDVTIDVDVIEEIARVHGYHTILSQLPEHAPPMTVPDKQLAWESDTKIRLRDWGFTELITYSMISESQMDSFGLDKAKAYKIANPLSEEWVYMRPSLWPTTLAAIKENTDRKKNLKIFELSMAYVWQQGMIPKETPVLIVAYTGNKFLEAKGLAEVLFERFGIKFPHPDIHTLPDWYEDSHGLSLGKYGSLGLVKKDLLDAQGIIQPVTILELDMNLLVEEANTAKTYVPVPKYPPVMEDLSFIVPAGFQVGPLIEVLKDAHTLVSHVTLLDVHKDTRTFHITYQHPTRNLTGEEIIPVRNTLIETAKTQFGVTLKG